LTFLTTSVKVRDIEQAKRLIDQRPIYRRSHRGLAANEVGCLGEAITSRVFQEHGIELTEAFTTTHDFVLSNGRTIEVKTKDRTVAPQPHFDCSVPEYVAAHQQASFFVFISLQRNRGVTEGLERFHTAHVVGVATPSMFVARGRLMKAGTTDSNGTTFWTSCLNISIESLIPFQTVAPYWRKPADNLLK
jgi:hypothetical protein